MNIQDIIRELESKPEQAENLAEIKAAAEQIEKEKYSRGQIRVVKRTNERVTIMAALDSQVEVIYNKTGRKALLLKEDTEEFIR